MPDKDHIPWNRDKEVGAKPPLTLNQVQTIRNLLTASGDLREQLMFELAIDTSFRGSDIVRLQVSHFVRGHEITDTIKLRPQKTKARTKKKGTNTGVAVGILKPETVELLQEYLEKTGKSGDDYLFTPLRGKQNPHITPHGYRGIVKRWFTRAEINTEVYASHSLRRVNPTLIYANTGNLKAVQELLGHTSIENTAKYLGVGQAEAIDTARKYRAQSPVFLLRTRSINSCCSVLFSCLDSCRSVLNVSI